MASPQLLQVLMPMLNGQPPQAVYNIFMRYGLAQLAPIAAQIAQSGNVNQIVALLQQVSPQQESQIMQQVFPPTPGGGSAAGYSSPPPVTSPNPPVPIQPSDGGASGGGNVIAPSGSTVPPNRSSVQVGQQLPPDTPRDAAGKGASMPYDGPVNTEQTTTTSGGGTDAAGATDPTMFARFVAALAAQPNAATQILQQAGIPQPMIQAFLPMLQSPQGQQQLAQNLSSMPNLNVQFMSGIAGANTGNTGWGTGGGSGGGTVSTQSSGIAAALSDPNVVQKARDWAFKRISRRQSLTAVDMQYPQTVNGKTYQWLPFLYPNEDPSQGSFFGNDLSSLQAFMDTVLRDPKYGTPLIGQTGNPDQTGKYWVTVNGQKYQAARIDDYRRFQVEMVNSGRAGDAESYNAWTAWAQQHGLGPVITDMMGNFSMMNNYVDASGGVQFIPGTGYALQGNGQVNAPTVDTDASMCYAAGYYWNGSSCDRSKDIYGNPKSTGGTMPAKQACDVGGFLWVGDETTGHCDYTKKSDGTPSGYGVDNGNGGGNGGDGGDGGNGGNGGNANVTVNGSGSLEQYAAYVQYLYKQLEDNKSIEQAKIDLQRQIALGKFGNQLTLEAQQKLADNVFKQVAALQQQAQLTGTIKPITGWTTDANGLPVPTYGAEQETLQSIAQRNEEARKNAELTGVLYNSVSPQQLKSDATSLYNRVLQSFGYGTPTYQSPTQDQWAAKVQELTGMRPEDATRLAAAWYGYSGERNADAFANVYSAQMGGSGPGQQTLAGQKQQYDIASQQAQQRGYYVDPVTGERTTTLDAEIRRRQQKLAEDQLASQLAANPRDAVQSLYYNFMRPIQKNVYDGSAQVGGQAPGSGMTPQSNGGDAAMTATAPANSIAQGGQQIANSDVYKGLIGQTNLSSTGAPSGTSTGMNTPTLVQGNNLLPGVPNANQADLFNYRAMSPTQRQVLQSLISAQGIDPQDYEDQMKRSMPNAGNASLTPKYNFGRI